MTTLTNVFQVWALSDGAAIRDASGLVHQVHHRDMDWLDFVAYPVETLHPRTVSRAAVDVAKDVMRRTDAWVAIALATGVTVEEAARFRDDLINAALTALKIGVTE